MKDYLLTKSFWLQAIQRSIRTFAQSAIAVIGVGTTNLLTADVKNILAVATSSAIISLLMSIDRSADTVVATAPWPDAEIEPTPYEPLAHTNMKG